MRKSFVADQEARASLRGQEIVISDEGEEKKDGCRYHLEIKFPEGHSISDQQISIRNVINIQNIHQSPKLNLQIDFSYLTAVKIIGNLAEALPLLVSNLRISEDIYEKIKKDHDAMRMVNESSTYILPPEIVDLDNTKLPKFTAEDYEEFGITPPSADKQPETPRSKPSFFESDSNTESSRSNSNPLSVDTTPDKNTSTPEESNNAIPSPVSPTIKVK